MVPPLEPSDESSTMGTTDRKKKKTKVTSLKPRFYLYMFGAKHPPERFSVRTLAPWRPGGPTPPPMHRSPGHPAGPLGRFIGVAVRGPRSASKHIQAPRESDSYSLQLFWGLKTTKRDPFVSFCKEALFSGGWSACTDSAPCGYGRPFEGSSLPTPLVRQ